MRLNHSDFVGVKSGEFSSHTGNVREFAWFEFINHRECLTIDKYPNNVMDYSGNLPCGDLTVCYGTSTFVNRQIIIHHLINGQFSIASYIC